MTLTELVRANRRTILPALAFCVANLALFSAYRLLYAGRVEILTSRLERRQADLVTLEAKRAGLAEKAARADERAKSVATLYDQRFGSEAERLTAFLSEVKDLAGRAGLDPPGFNYPTQEIADYGLLERASEFSVEGSYEDLRRFINFLEISESFLMLQEISLSDRSGDPRAGAPLAIKMRLATLFVDPRGARTSRRQTTSTARATPPAAPAAAPGGSRSEAGEF